MHFVEAKERKSRVFYNTLGKHFRRLSKKFILL